VKDAKEIRDILRESYYIDELRELYDSDASAAGIRQLFSNLRPQVGRDDSVFVFYAGHGHSDDLTNTGSWIPADGGRDLFAQANWLPNIQIRNMLQALPAKHVFLISDSCFSGDMLDASRGAGPVIDSNYYRRAYSLVSRQVMTSGASETVPDASEFAMRLKSGLRRAEGACIDPQYLFTIVREVRSTQPMLGSIRGSEHQEGGSFLFFRKQPAAAVSPPESLRVLPDVPEAAAPIRNPIRETGTPRKESNPAQLWSVGASAGTSFSDPLFIGTVQATLAPFPYSFLQIGLDLGLLSGIADAGYYSLYPFAHYALFVPFGPPGQNPAGGWYIGGGAGFLFAEYDFPEGKAPVNIFALDLTAGFTFANGFHVSYTLQTDFTNAGNKISLGYVYRF
jgi:hypothetical protein